MLDANIKHTPEEYLAREAAAEYKSEYHDGEIRAMAGGSAEHSIISVNVISVLDSLLERKPCQVYNSDMRLLVQDRAAYVYPNAMVICGHAEFQFGRTDVVTNPVIIFEALSPTTRQHDVIEKFALYKRIETVQEYVIVDSERVHVTILRRGTATGKWTIEMIEDRQEILVLDSLGIEIPVQRLYRNVEFGNANVR